MIVYHPKEKSDALDLFPCFVDMLIKLINDAKLEVSKRRNWPLDLYIYLGNRTYAYISYKEMRGWETVTPIQRFEFTLCQAGIVKLELISQQPHEYDKMLELFKTCLNSIEKSAPEDYGIIINKVDLPSLDRNNWKKSVLDIKKETESLYDIKRAREDLDRKVADTFGNLSSKYRDQGYEITEE